MTRRRLDLEIVRRGLLASREQARAAIGAGSITVGGAPAGKPSRLVAPDEPIELLGPGPRYVSRAGEKLHGALERFAVSVEGRRALDVGSSTGGFTDCMLQHGAAHVVAVDVGRNQLRESLLGDPRVTSLERTDIRSVSAADLGGAVDLVTADVSFISLRAVLPAIVALAEPGADLVLLVKPQFEAGREVVSRGRGVVRDPEEWAAALRGAMGALEDLGAAIMGAMASPLRGADGNVELLVHARAPGGEGPRPVAHREAMIAAAVAEAGPSEDLS